MKHKIIISISLGLIVSIVLSTLSFAKSCENIRKNVIRLHIVAASDSEEDQRLKLKVRDELLNCSPDLFDGITDIDSAMKKIESGIPELRQTAEKVIKQNGYDYNVSVSLKKEFFTTREYDDFTMPAGEYEALRVVIGEGNGHNWWCVIYPALCIPAAKADSDAQTILGKKEYRIITDNTHYEPRFKIVEMFEDLKYKIKRK